MPFGTTITAAHEGKVVHIEESGYDSRFPNNLVIVQHSDESYAQYVQLTRNGAKVIIVQNVTKGQEIGLSSSTGLAGYPHLHFVITKSGKWEYPYTSIPNTFRNTTANKFSLQMGQSYKALPCE